MTYRDDNFAGRAGWKEIVVSAEEPAKLLSSSVPPTDRSSELSNYPTDLLNSPPQDLQARAGFTLAAGNPSAASAQPAELRSKKPAVLQKPKVPPQAESAGSGGDNVPATNMGRTESAPAGVSAHSRARRSETPRDSFTELMTIGEPDWRLVIFALIIAMGLGAFHALEPGHGKTLVAAYLVGSRGTTRHALLLGLVVTAAHTAGVYLLGAVTLYASHYIVPERIYPWLALVSGVMIILFGAVLVVRCYRGEAIAHSHSDAAHGAHAHRHAHSHSHDHNHHSVSNDAHRSASLRELISLGISGGIVPCPAALVVLLSALSMNRLGFGLLLIVAFSAGLAAVLVGIGVLMVFAGRFMARFKSEAAWATRWLPITSSVFILMLGVALVWQTLQTTVSVWRV
jgi:ABC-type nickel/cobalt efflux system permease component RcnA